MQPDHDAVGRRIDEIEAEMRRIGMWQAEELPDEKRNPQEAFGSGTMSFEQWLQFVLVPRVREIVAARGTFPAVSQVADKAFREWRMWGEVEGVEGLLEMLRGFDGMFGWE